MWKATKGVRWMPWRQEPMKGVDNCDKPREAVVRCRSGDARMGKPTQGNAWVPLAEHIGQLAGTEGTETSKYLEEKRLFPE